MRSSGARPHARAALPALQWGQENGLRLGLGLRGLILEIRLRLGLGLRVDISLKLGLVLRLEDTRK